MVKVYGWWGLVMLRAFFVVAVSMVTASCSHSKFTGIMDVLLSTNRVSRSCLRFLCWFEKFWKCFRWGRISCCPNPRLKKFSICCPWEITLVYLTCVSSRVKLSKPPKGSKKNGTWPDWWWCKKDPEQGTRLLLMLTPDAWAGKIQPLTFKWHCPGLIQHLCYVIRVNKTIMFAMNKKKRDISKCIYLSIFWNTEATIKNNRYTFLLSLVLTLYWRLRVNLNKHWFGCVIHLLFT